MEKQRTDPTRPARRRHAALAVLAPVTIAAALVGLAAWGAPHWIRRLPVSADPTDRGTDPRIRWLDRVGAGDAELRAALSTEFVESALRGGDPPLAIDRAQSAPMGEDWFRLHGRELVLALAARGDRDRVGLVLDGIGSLAAAPPADRQLLARAAAWVGRWPETLAAFQASWSEREPPPEQLAWACAGSLESGHRNALERCLHALGRSISVYRGAGWGTELPRALRSVASSDGVAALASVDARFLPPLLEALVDLGDTAAILRVAGVVRGTRWAELLASYDAMAQRDSAETVAVRIDAAFGEGQERDAFTIDGEATAPGEARPLAPGSHRLRFARGDTAFVLDFLVPRGVLEHVVEAASAEPDPFRSAEEVGFAPR